MSTTYLIKNAAVLGGEPTDLLLEDGVVRQIGEISPPDPLLAAARLMPAFMHDLVDGHSP